MIISIGIYIYRGIVGGAGALAGLLRATEDNWYRCTEDGSYRELDS